MASIPSSQGSNYSHHSQQSRDFQQQQQLQQMQMQSPVGSPLKDGSIVQMPYGTGLITYVQSRLAIIPVLLQHDNDNNVVVLTRSDVPTQFLPQNPHQWPSLSVVGFANVSVVNNPVSSAVSSSSQQSLNFHRNASQQSETSEVDRSFRQALPQDYMDTVDDQNLKESLLSGSHRVDSSGSGSHDHGRINGTSISNGDGMRNESDFEDDDDDDDDEDEEDEKKPNFALRLITLVLFATVVLITALWLGTRDSYEEISPVYVMHNGIIYEGSPAWAERQLLKVAEPEPTAFVVGSNGRFLKIGSDEEILGDADYSRLPRVDLAKKFVLPGIGDSHGHVTFYGMGLTGPQIRGSTSVAKVIQVLLQYCKDNNIDPTVDNGVFLTAWGWDHELFAENITSNISDKDSNLSYVHSERISSSNIAGNFPTAAELDAAFPGVAVVLDRIDGHAVWVNSKAMQVAGPIPPIDPPNGKIDRDEKGNPRGCFFDEAIMIFKKSCYNTIPAEMRRKAIEHAAGTLSSFGITTVHHQAMLTDDFDVMSPMAASQRDIAYVATTNTRRDMVTTSLLKTSYGHGLPVTYDPLPLRITGYLDAERVCVAAIDYKCPPSFPTKAPIDHTKYLNNPIISPSGFPIMRSSTNGRLQMTGAKVFLDGSLGSYGAALKTPYQDNPSTSGTLYYSSKATNHMLSRLRGQGFQLAVHAVGDRAVTAAITAFGKIAQEHGSLFTDFRHRLEHMQVVDVKEDSANLIKYGVIPSIQPTHAISDMKIAVERLGRERLNERGYLAESFRTISPQIPFGTDFPVESPNPWRTLHAAVTRQDSGGFPEDGFLPDERVTRVYALKSMTYDVAYAANTEHYMGTISEGKVADFVILDKDSDILNIDDEALQNIKPVATFIDGNLVYAADVSQ